MIEMELIIALGVIVIPIYIHKFITFCIDAYKHSKQQKMATFKERLIEKLKE